MLEFLNQNSGAFSLIFSAIVAISTIVYACLTWKLVSETRRMRELQTEPKLSVYVQYGKYYPGIVLVIKNIGMGPAQNIKFDVDNDIIDTLFQPLANSHIFKYGINYLAPNQSMYVTLLSTQKQQPTDGKFNYNISATCINSIGKKITNEFFIDFNELSSIYVEDEGSIRTISQNISKIERNIRDLVSVQRKILSKKLSN